MKSVALFAFVTVAGFALSANAQTSVKTCPAGTTVSMVRISTIKPTGSMAGFLEAVQDHAKWYRDHGHTADEITSSPILEKSEDGKTWAVSKTRAFSIHKNDYGVPKAEEEGAEWKAFVAKYRANSDIESVTVVCLPK